MSKTPQEYPSELALIISNLMLHVSGIKNKYGSPTVNSPQMNDELDREYHNALQTILKHFVPKEEAEDGKRETLVSIRKKFEGLGFTSELPEEFVKGLEAAQQAILDTLDTELTQLTNNQRRGNDE